MTDNQLKATAAVILFMIGLFIGASAATSNEETRCKHEAAAALASADVGQKCATVLDGCMATLKTCTEALQKGVVK